MYKSWELKATKPTDYESKEMWLILCQRSRLWLQEGVLYLKVGPIQEDQNDMQLILPKPFRHLAMQGYHNDLVHLGMECMLDLLHDQFHWPTMAHDAEYYVNMFGVLKFKAQPQREKMYPILVIYHLELVNVDFLSIKNPHTGKDINVLMITGHFPHYA